MHTTLRTRAASAAAAGTLALVVPLLVAAPAVAGDGRPSDERGDQATQADGNPSGYDAEGDAGFQGKSPSAPDQDGRGTDRGAGNNDKDGNAGDDEGSYDATDGNNGCGNEQRDASAAKGPGLTDDDSNGWCGGKVKPAAQPPATGGGGQPGGGQPGVGGGQLTPGGEAPGGGGQPGEPAGQPAGTVAVLSSTVTAPAVLGEVLTGSRTVVSASPLPGLSLGGSTQAGQARPSVLPFTGGPATLLLAGAGLLTLAGGSGLFLLGRRES